jgi:hypothetical protein
MVRQNPYMDDALLRINHTPSARVDRLVCKGAATSSLSYVVSLSLTQPSASLLPFPYFTFSKKEERARNSYKSK